MLTNLCYGKYGAQVLAFIYQGEEEIVVDVLVQRTDKNKLLTKAVQYCFMYDYTGQAEKIY